MKKLAYAIPLLTALVAGTAFAGATQKDAANAIMEAVQMNNKAHKAGFEWRDTYKKLLGPAKKAYKKGDFDKAVSLANTAKAHAELGLEQAKMAPMANLH